MKLNLVTCGVDPSQGGFAPDPLAEIEGEIMSVVEHWPGAGECEEGSDER